jgi:hypothetical protein
MGGWMGGREGRREGERGNSCQQKREWIRARH